MIAQGDTRYKKKEERRKKKEERRKNRTGKSLEV